MIDFLYDFSKLILYFIICASAALIIKKYTEIPREVYRKFLHLILLGSAPILLYMFSSCRNAVLGTVVFAAVVYPALSLAEHHEAYSNLLAERNRGEIKRSLAIVFGMFAIVISITWGILEAKYLALAVTLGWGLGDAAAALIGKKFGKNHFKNKFTDANKTIEGTVAMFTVSVITIFTVLVLNNTLPLHSNLLIAVPAAAISAFAELSTKNGFDTLTCPAATLMVMLPLLYLWGGIL